MSVPTMEELKVLRVALATLEDRKDQACVERKNSVDAMIAWDIAHQQWWTASANYTRKLNEFIEAGAVEGVRP